LKNSLKISSKTRLIVTCAFFVAMAFVLSLMKIFAMPMGGSVTLASVPLIIVSIVHGPFYGLACAAVLGILKIFTSGHIIGWSQAVLDYPLANPAFAIAGFCPRKSIVATIFITMAAFLVKTALHVFSGYLFFSGNLNASLAYNLYYSVPEMALCCVAVYAIVKNGAIFKIDAGR